MAIFGYSRHVVEAPDAETVSTKALVDKVLQLEHRISHFVDDTVDYGDVNTDTELKETVRTA